jgi:glutamate synthase (NADPH/NADH) large chain
MGGLYRGEYEHDACGIGFVANISGRRDGAILGRGLDVLERMEHRGAESADNKTGDGSGVLLQIPHAYYKTLVPGLPDAGGYGTGLLFLPKKAELARLVEDALPEIAARSSLSLFAGRDVPVNSGALGVFARSVEPRIRQLFLVPEKAGLDLPVALYLFRKRLEKLVYAHADLKKAGCYMPSLSDRVIVYKGMMMPDQVRS